MNKQEYIENVKRTESGSFFQKDVDPRLVHGIIGLVTEAGELLDALKKSYFYGKELDVTNILEERGDIEWYLALIDDVLNLDEKDIRRKNIEKLKTRYPEKWNMKEALERNLEKERLVLEK